MIFTNIAIGLIQLVITLVFAVLALYIGLAVYSRIVQTVDTDAEFSRGNVAVAIVIAAVFVAIAIVVVYGAAGLTMGIGKALETGMLTVDGFFILGIALVQFFLGIVLAVGAIALSLKVLERLVTGIDVFKELQKGNVAVALMVAGIIIAMAVIIQSGVLGITSLLG